MDTIYIVTGAAGYLGGSIVRDLLRRGERVRAFDLPGKRCWLGDVCADKLELYEGDVRRPETLEPLFENSEGFHFLVIHCAGIICISKNAKPKLWEVNVEGTKNILNVCRTHKVSRLVYVSSVHALPLLPWGHTMGEVGDFDPDIVTGAYARTKAAASQLVLNAAVSGLDAVIVHPSGIIGPMGTDSSNMTHMIISYLCGRLPGGIQGGFDFVDVRDVALGVLAAAEKGCSGQCYVLSNRFIDLREFFGALADVAGISPPRVYFPMWIAKALAPFFEVYYRITKRTPLYTAYSLHTLSSNAIFSHEKASRELGYVPRNLCDTLGDTVEWLKSSKDITPKPWYGRGGWIIQKLMHRKLRGTTS